MSEEVEIDKVEVAFYIVTISLLIIFSLMMLGIDVPWYILIAFGISAMIIGVMKIISGFRS